MSNYRGQHKAADRVVATWMRQAMKKYGLTEEEYIVLLLAHNRRTQLIIENFAHVLFMKEGNNYFPMSCEEASEIHASALEKVAGWVLPDNMKRNGESH